MGCAILAAKAALRSGCGLVSVHLPQQCVNPMQVAFPEAMVSIDPHESLFCTPPPHLERYNALAIGPGIGTNPETQEALLKTLRKWPSDRPIVLDADALNIMALRKDILEAAAMRETPTAVTPHEGEYSRLFGHADASEMAKQYGLIIVRKAHRTRIYAPDGRIHENHTGNAGMATAGSGDVLTGMTLGLLSAQAKKEEVYEVVCRAVEIHGKCGDMAVHNQSESSLIASDLIEYLKRVSTDETGY